MAKCETEGWHNGKVVEYQPPMKNDKGNWAAKLTIENEHGERAWRDLYFTPDAREKSLARLEAIFGYTGGYAGLETFDPVGMPVNFLIEPSEYNGVTSMRCNAIGKPGGGAARRERDPLSFGAFLEDMGVTAAAASANSKDDLPF